MIIIHTLKNIFSDTTSRFLPRVRALRCAHPSYWAHYHAKLGAVRPPAHRSFAALPPPKINYFQKQNAFLQARTRTARGVYFFTRLSYILLSYIAPY
jgi:hypothetical protein